MKEGKKKIGRKLMSSALGNVIEDIQINYSLSGKSLRESYTFSLCTCRRYALNSIIWSILELKCLKTSRCCFIKMYIFLEL